MLKAINCVTYLILICITVTGTGGNLAVLVIFGRTPAFQTHNNALHVSLAIADLLSCIVTAPVAMVVTSFPDININLHWRRILCHLQQFLAIVSGIDNMLTTTAICVLRTKVLLNPTWNYSASTTYRLIAATWAVSLLMGVLSLTLFRMENFDICALEDGKRSMGPFFAKNFGLPTVYAGCVIILACYAVIFAWKAKMNAQKTRKHGGQNQILCNSDSAKLQRQISVQIAKSRDHLHPSMTSIHTTFILAILIIVSYAPITILGLVNLKDNKTYHAWYSFSFAFLLLANSLNPYIYTLRCAAFRKEIHKLWAKFIQEKHSRRCRSPHPKCKV